MTRLPKSLRVRKSVKRGQGVEGERRLEDGKREKAFLNWEGKTLRMRPKIHKNAEGQRC